MEDKRQKPIRGIRIRTLNFVMIAVSCVLYVLLIAATIHVSRSYTDVHTSMDDYIGCEQSDTLLTEGSAYLTEQVRLYVVTLDPQCIENYFIEANATRRREKALEQLQVHHDSEEAYQFLVEALENSNDLMVREIHAMRLAAQASGQNLSELPEAVRTVQLSGNELSLTPDEQLSRAREMVFGDAYQASKALITGNVEYSLGTIHSATHQEMLHSAEELERTMSQQRVLISVLFVESLITFILIILLIVKPLQIYVNCIKEDKMMEIVGSYEFKYLALTYNDIYEVNAANEMMLRHKAEHDPLTGIMNRGAFDHLRALLAGKATPLALLIIDVDYFKQVNDGYGHEAGDQVLKKVARLLSESFRNTDYPARIGGDEFAMILTDITSDMQPIVESKVASINSTLTHPTDGLPPVSLSVGGAFSASGFTDGLYKEADLALYRVKEQGRCGCRFYHQEDL